MKRERDRDRDEERQSGREIKRERSKIERGKKEIKGSEDMEKSR